MAQGHLELMLKRSSSGVNLSTICQPILFQWLSNCSYIGIVVVFIHVIMLVRPTLTKVLHYNYIGYRIDFRRKISDDTVQHFIDIILNRVGREIAALLHLCQVLYSD